MSLLALLAAQDIVTPDPDPEPEPPVDPATLTTLRQVTDRTAWWRSTTAADATQGTTIVTQHTMRAPAKALRIRWGVHGWAGAGDGFTGKAALVIGGTFHRLTWGGAESYFLPNDGKTHTSDPLPESVQVEAGQTIYAVWEAPAGGRYVNGHHGWDEPMQRVAIGPYPGAAGSMDLRRLSGSPQGIYGLTTESAQSFVCLGDSILESGWMRRAAHTNGLAWSDLSMWAEGIPASGTNGLQARLNPSDPPLYTLGLTEYGTNARAQPVATIKANLLSQWKWMTAGPVERLGQTTMVPYTASGGNYTTLDGQTETDRAWRDELNGWLRDGAPLTADGTAPAAIGTTGALRAGQTGHPLIGVCDIAAATEATNSRGEIVWRVDKGAATPDGVHPTRVGADLMEPVVTEWIAQHL